MLPTKLQLLYMRLFSKALLAKLSLAISAIVIPVFIADTYFRLSGMPKGNARIMLLSGGSLQTSPEGVRKYSPYSTIQHSAVYGRSIAYRYEFKTDNNGFRSTYECTDVQKNNAVVAIAGDSYTEAQGSSISGRNIFRSKSANKATNLLIPLWLVLASKT